MFHVPEEFRVRHSKNSKFNTTTEDGNNGTFAIKKTLNNPYQIRNKHGISKKSKFKLFLVLASDGMDWEHVSVSIVGKFKELPTWDEMCHIKDLFWDNTDTVVQYHPAEEDYVNNASVLHMWRPTKEDVLKPPPILVGIKGLENLEK